jgi:hypothetical protein
LRIAPVKPTIQIRVQCEFGPGSVTWGAFMHRRPLLILPALALLLFWASVPAQAAGEPEIASDDLTIALEGGDATKLGLEKDREYGPTTANVLLRNPTTKAATVKLWAWLDDGQRIAITRVKDEAGAAIDLAVDPVATLRAGMPKLNNNGEFALPAKSMVPVDVTFEHLKRSSSTEGHLALGGPSVSTMSVVGLSFEQPTPLWYLWVPIGVGAFLTGVFMLARLMTMGERKRTYLPPIQTWTFKDGWASNIVVIGAVVAAIIAALGSLGSETFGDFSVANFVGLNLVFAAMVLVAPLTYSALRKRRVVRDHQQAEENVEPPDQQQKRAEIAGTVAGLMVAASALWTRVVRDQQAEKTVEQSHRQQAERNAEQPYPHPRSSAIAGTVAGLMVAASAVLWAAFGQLTTLFILVLAASNDLEELLLQGGLILLAAFFVFLYAWKSLGWTVNGYAELSPDEQQKVAKTQVELDIVRPVGPAVEHRTITL